MIVGSSEQATARRLLIGILLGAACYVGVLTGLITVGTHITPPEPELALTPGGGALAAAFHVLTGQGGTTDFLVDYSSAHALRSGISPYETSALLNERVGTPWAVLHANPHPPTALTLVLPFTVVRYEWALAAWGLGMLFAFVATFRLVGVRPVLAVAAAVGVAITWPGAYALGNLVPLIGLGAALAWRGRDNPAIAGAGLALAAIPKASGLVLLVPFILTARWKSVSWALLLTLIVALVPLAFDPTVWSAYFDSGLEAIRLTMNRPDNASLLARGVPRVIAGLVLLLAAMVASFRINDMFWPAVWLAVAALPIAWMYSLLTLAPGLIRGLNHGRAVPWVVVGIALAVGSSPLGMWPTLAFGSVVGIAYAAMCMTAESDGFPPPRLLFGRPHRAALRATARDSE